MNRVHHLLAVAALIITPAAMAEGDADAGKGLFGSRCVFCHDVETGEKGNKPGPSLKGISESKKFPSGKEATEDNFNELLEKGAQGMPPFAGSDEDKANLYAYVMTL